jgi:hypothetical protein
MVIRFIDVGNLMMKLRLCMPAVCAQRRLPKPAAGLEPWAYPPTSALKAPGGGGRKGAKFRTKHKFHLREQERGTQR